MIYIDEILILQTAYEDKKKTHVHHILFVGKQLSNARIISFNELFQIHDLGILWTRIFPCGVMVK